MLSEDFFKTLQNHYRNQLPFVVYRHPNTSTLKALLQKDTKLNFTKDYSESGFVFAPFNTNETTVLLPLESSENITSEYIVSEKYESTLVDSVNSKEKEQHTKLVEKGVKTILEGQLNKVVLSRVESVEILERNPIEIFKKLLDNYLTAFVYLWYHPKVGLWLGATPETLIKVEGNRFATMALAGTQKYNGTLDVTWSEKEKQEQQIVTNSIYRNLKQKTDTISLSDTITVKAGHLLHLQTKISGTILKKLEDINLQLLLSGLHPTPAVCGFPQETAKQFILENENYNREYYTGFLGEINVMKTTSRNRNNRNVENNAYTSVKKVSSLYVNLRCMQIKESKALIYVGGGVTKDSIPEAEWEETVNKTSTIKNML